MRSIHTMLTNKPREGDSLFHTGQMISIIADDKQRHHAPHYAPVSGAGPDSPVSCFTY